MPRISLSHTIASHRDPQDPQDPYDHSDNSAQGMDYHIQHSSWYESATDGGEEDPLVLGINLTEGIHEIASLPSLMLELMTSSPELSVESLRYLVTQAIKAFLAPLKYDERMDAMDERLLSMARQGFEYSRMLRTLPQSRSGSRLITFLMRRLLRRASSYLVLACEAMSDIQFSHKQLKETYYSFSPNPNNTRAIQRLETELGILESERSQFDSDYRIGSSAWAAWSEQKLELLRRERRLMELALTRRSIEARLESLRPTSFIESLQDFRELGSLEFFRRIEVGEALIARRWAAEREEEEERRHISCSCVHMRSG